MVEMAIFNIQRAITLKVGKQGLLFKCSACYLMVFNICVKFHENMSCGFKVMERTQKMLIHTHREKTKPIYPIGFVCRGYNQNYGSCVLHAFSWFNICVKLHEHMSCSFKLMERTQKLLTHKGQ